MKTAVIYSGQARSFGRLFENHYFHLLRKLPDPEFFVSVVDDEDAPSMARIRERFDTPLSHFEAVTQPNIEEPPPDPKWLPGYPPSVPPQAILRQLWHLNRAWEFANLTGDFDWVIRIRPDIAFHRFVGFGPISSNQAVTPWWSRWGGINDRLAVLGQRAAEAYFTTFQRRQILWDFGCPLHPETMLATSLEEEGVRISHTLAAEFCTVRKDGTFLPMDPTVVDIVDYARSGERRL